MADETPTFKYCVIIMVFLGMLTAGASGGVHEKKLLKNVLSDYMVYERPVRNESFPLDVSLGFTLLNLIEVNIGNKYLTANIWMTMKWNDANLRWNSTDYGGIKSLTIPRDRIWIPEIYVHNSLSPDFDPTFQTNTIVQSDGNVSYISPGIFKSPCVNYRDLAKFYPYDEQECYLRFESWTTDSTQINLVLDSENGTDLSKYAPNDQWELLGASATLNQVLYVCCPDAYLNVVFAISLRRHGETMFWRLSLALLFGFTAMLFTFLLPPRAEQRIGLGVVTFLAVLIVSVSIQINIRRSSIMTFNFSRLAFLVFTSILSNVCIIYLYNLNPTVPRMPDLIRKLVFDVIPPFIFIQGVPKNISSTVAISTDGNDHPKPDLKKELVLNLQALMLKMEPKGIQSSTSVNDWQYFAIVLDRIIFLFYLQLSFVFLILFCCSFA